ncbi:MAG: hypothetical protein K2G96_05720, partial [Clostridia bacterium]|nr:hypothetical protein [Clostridia bacterium]
IYYSMENLPTIANDNGGSVYRHEPRSLEFFNDSDTGFNCDCGCNSCNSCNNGSNSPAGLLFLLSLWGFLNKSRTQTQSSATAQNSATEQTEEPSC